MAERKKLELELNKPLELTLLFDEPMTGNSRYGSYYLYAVRNGSDTEYSFFAPDDVHEQIKGLKKGDRFQITKIAEQNGTKIITRHEVKPVNQTKEAHQQTKEPIPASMPPSDNYYGLMLASCRDAVRIQNELGGLMDAKSVAVTLFIARTKSNGYG